MSAIRVKTKEVNVMTRGLLNLVPRAGSFLPGRDIFDRFFEDQRFPALFGEESAWVPAFDVMETEKEYVVKAELPGINVKDLEVTLSDGILTVKGEKTQEKEEKNENYHRVERSYGSFHRSFRIPEKILTDKVDAAYKNGILKLTIPKAEASEAKKIEIKQAS
jgi:HSP20 family protein